MKQQLGWTTLEQSKQLIEAGLDPNTADMSFLYDWNNSKNFDVPDTLVTHNWDKDYNKNIPCWSLGALIELMPKEINGERLTIELTNWSDWKYEVGYGLDTFQNNTLFDSILECMIWFLENTYGKEETK